MELELILIITDVILNIAILRLCKIDYRNEDAKLIREGKLTAISYTTNYPKRFKRLTVIVLVIATIIQVGAQKPIPPHVFWLIPHCMYLCYYCMIAAVCRKSYFTVSEEQLSFIYQYRLEWSLNWNEVDDVSLDNDRSRQLGIIHWCYKIRLKNGVEFGGLPTSLRKYFKQHSFLRY